jgi:hypothetical protein
VPAPVPAVALGVMAAGADAVAAATTTPFTWQADLVTALPIAALAVGALWRWPLHPRPRPAREPGPAGEAGEPGEPRRPGQPGQPGLESGASRALGAFGPWCALVLVVVAWELFEYLAPGSRGAHPTLSSMADALDRHRAAKAVVFAAWLCLGACIVRAGARDASGVATPPS